MTFAKVDVGEGLRSPAGKADCTVRALSTATGLPYHMAWKLLYEHQGARQSNAFDLGALLDQRLTGAPLGDIGPLSWWTRRALQFPAVRGKPRMTPKAFAQVHPVGRFVLRLAHHVVAVHEGVVIDTWDCTKRCVYKAWEIALPK